ncbi:MAG: MmgE/PrpD family protein, partial [Alphaproteobacteria bacterium]|nr:MmgE/PrpD family protein [Alphaproteobacteria bacterium]
MTNKRRIDADARAPRAPAASLARRLADWAVALRPADIPQRQRRLAGLRVIDTLGLVLAGCRTPAATAVYDLAAAAGGRPEAPLVGARARVPMAMAALAHGPAAHCRDFDDTLTDSVDHPGSVLVPVALALGEARHAAHE